jgi:hypothetical protein
MTMNESLERNPRPAAAAGRCSRRATEDSRANDAWRGLHHQGHRRMSGTRLNAPHPPCGAGRASRGRAGPVAPESLARSSAIVLVLTLAVSSVLQGCGGARDGGSAQAQPTATPAAPATPAASNRAAPAATGPRVTTAPPAAARPAATSSGAQIQFLKRTHDFGVISDTREYQASYPFRNTGTGTLIIESVKAGCGCTVPTLAKYEYAPGEQGQIDIVFTPKAMQGSKPKSITVLSNSAANAKVDLEFTSTIRPLVRFDTRFLKLGDLRLGQEHRQRFNMYYEDPELVFSSFEVTAGWISAHLVEEKAAQPGGGYKAVGELVVSPDAPWGSLYSVRLMVYVTGRVELGIAPIDYDYELYVQGNIFGDIQSTASMRGRNDTLSSSISLGQVPPGAEFERSVRLTRTSGQPFTITDTRVECTLSGVKVRYEAAAPNAYDVFVYGNTGDFTGTIEGGVEIRTDVPGEELLMIRMLGRVDGEPALPGS